MRFTAYCDAEEYRDAVATRLELSNYGQGCFGIMGIATIKAVSEFIAQIIQGLMAEVMPCVLMWCGGFTTVKFIPKVLNYTISTKTA